MKENKAKTFSPSARNSTAFSPGSTVFFELAKLLDCDTEEKLIKNVKELVGRILNPAAWFLGIPMADAPTHYALHAGHRIPAEEFQPVYDYLSALLSSSGLDGIFLELFRSFPAFENLSGVLVKTPAGETSRILLVAFGSDSGMQEFLILLEPFIRLKLENLRLRWAEHKRLGALSGLHQAAGVLNKIVFQAPRVLSVIAREARRVLGVDGAAILVADREKKSFMVRASEGFESSPIPLSPVFFFKAVEDYEISGKKTCLFRNEKNELQLLVHLAARQEESYLLFFYNKNADFFATTDLVQIGEIFGDWASMALDNAFMFERISGSQQEWENTFDSIADPIYIVDSEYRLKKMNKSLAGYAMKSIKLPLEKTCYRYLFNRSTICPWCPVPRGVQSGQPITVETPLFADSLWQIQSFPLTDKKGDRIGSINVLRDITVLKRMQEQLIESEKMASIGKLISGVAHEVRNPLFGISTTARALANELDNKEELKPYLDIITSETARLNRLMEDLLNYSRPVRIDKNQSDMAEIVKEVVASFKSLPAAQGASFQLHVSDQIPPIYVDRNKINQVLFNLFENSIQHARGPARIDIFLEFLALSNPPEIHLVIKDNGSGISPEHLSRIFDPFFTTRQRGTGLGLSIVRKVIHDHGGRISVESHLGVGTTFRISLPVTLSV